MSTMQPTDPTSIMSLEERLRRLEDLEAIRSLFQTYRNHLDGRDLVGLSQLFAPDAEWHGGSMRATGGPAAILAMLEDRFGPEGQAQDCHIVANPVIEVTGDRARTTCTYLLIQPTPDGLPQLRMLGEYVDELVRDGSRWLFARRVARVDIPAIGLVQS